MAWSALASSNRSSSLRISSFRVCLRNWRRWSSPRGSLRADLIGEDFSWSAGSGLGSTTLASVVFGRRSSTGSSPEGGKAKSCVVCGDGCFETGFAVAPSVSPSPDKRSSVARSSKEL